MFARLVTVLCIRRTHPPLSTRYTADDGHDVPLGHHTRPSWRGRIHLIALCCFVPAVVVLTLASTGRAATAGAAIYGLGLCSMFGSSTVYHRWVHGLRTRAMWRRIDHAAIYAAIAGSATPLALTTMDDADGRLVVAAAEVRAPAIDLAPCCYQLTAAETYQPLLADSALKLDRVALKLAVTETVTASPREAANSAQASAWKLAFLNLREQLLPTAAYQPFRPVPASWQGEGFAGFLSRLAEREALPLPAGLDLLACEAAGWQRHHESRRLQLVRMAFRRAIEIWLLCDLAGWLEKQGYAVTLREFCARSLSPRNLLLSARLL